MVSASFASPAAIGFGTYRLKGDDVRRPLREAILAGYRHIDTAGVYKNEAEIGETLHELQEAGVIKRAELYLTSKLSPYDMHQPQQALDRTLQNLQTSYLDQYLIHWPGCSGKPPNSPAHAAARENAWRVLVAAHADGRIRYIGVSNYTAAHLRAMLDGSSGPVQFPHVLQMEFHPEYWRVAMQLHKEFMLQGMKIEGYAVLGEGRFANQDPCSPAVQRIAARLGATAPQVILGWALRKGVRVLVMSRNSEHLVENLAAETVATSMTAEDDIAIDESSSAEDRKICWDPSKVA